MTSTHSLWQFIRREPVLSISFVCALVSAFFVPPSAAYVDYIDLRVLCLLFCLMAVVAGLQECGLFLVLAQRLLAGERPVRLISLTLILLPFFCSMLVTNDVALITFVPFAILVLEMVGRRDLLIPIISLQTVAANLGSMATPVGNPQNLFLYAHFSLSMGDFLSLLLPLTLISLVGLAAGCILAARDGSPSPFRSKCASPAPNIWPCTWCCLACACCRCAASCPAASSPSL